MSLNNEIAEFVRTLSASGFSILSVERKPNFTIVDAARRDEFCLEHKYMFAYSGEHPTSAADRSVLIKLSQKNSVPVVMISDCDGPTEGLTTLSRSKFFSKVGGPIISTLALEPEYGRRLMDLGFNRLPPDLKGKPDDLFEAYVHAGLQFLLKGRVIRYGQERSFEAVADGAAVGSNTPLMLYDCKAAEGRYEFSKTTVRQFGDYVNGYHRRYEQSVGRLHAFVAVSSAFQATETIHERSGELYNACGIPIVCLTTEVLSALVMLFSTNVALRPVVDWKNIFRAPTVELKRALEEVDARNRDQILGA